MDPAEAVDVLHRYKQTRRATAADVARILDLPDSTVRRWVPGGRLPSPDHALLIVDRLLPLMLNRSQTQATFAPFDGSRPARDESSRATPAPVRGTAATPSQGSGSHELETDKRYFDPIHQDIHVTVLEDRIINTADFQRLDRFRQLASSYLVYRGAVHTRFAHSLGTLAQAEIMVAKINANRESTGKVDEEAHILTRLAALLHDIPYIPFGHELEDEAQIVEKHETRYRLFIGADTDIGQLIAGHFGADISEELVKTLEAKSDAEINALKYPFVSDLVGNTVCADLLDYLKRDNYYTGLGEHFGARFLDHLAIEEWNGAERLVVNLLRKDVPRRDVLSEVVHLLRARYTLGEKVYFHHAKQAASAMLAKGVYASGLHAHPRLSWIGDDELLHLLAISEDATARDIGKRLLSHGLYKRVYWAGAHQAHYHQEALASKLHGNPQQRGETESELARQCGLDPSDVVVYCPRPEMALKPAAVKVRWLDKIVRPLNEITKDPPAGEIRDLGTKHRSLWQLSVFIRPERLASHGKALSDACVHKWLLFNENPKYEGVGDDPSTTALLEVVEEDNITGNELGALRQFAARKTSVTRPSTAQEWRELRILLDWKES